jgi:hypothetical protein
VAGGSGAGSVVDAGVLGVPEAVTEPPSPPQPVSIEIRRSTEGLRLIFRQALSQPIGIAKRDEVVLQMVQSDAHLRDVCAQLPIHVGRRQAIDAPAAAHGEEKRLHGAFQLGFEIRELLAQDLRVLCQAFR